VVLTNDVFNPVLILLIVFFAEHTVPYITTPVFPLQSRYDSWQLDNILGTKSVNDVVNQYGALFDQRFQAINGNAGNGYFFWILVIITVQNGTLLESMVSFPVLLSKLGIMELLIVSFSNNKLILALLAVLQ